MALAALIDHSLVSAESSADGTSRFTMLETLREYALECLRAAGEEEQTRRQHAGYYAKLAKAAASPRIEQKFHDAELMQEFPNVRAALHWAATLRAVVPDLQLAAYAERLFLILGQNSEGYVWLERMLELDSQAGEDAAPVPVRLAALNAAGMLASNLGRTERATALAQEELSLAERLGDHTSMSNALARSRYRESLPVYRKLGNLSYTAMCLEGIAALACAEGHYEQAACLCAHATALRLKAQTPLPKVEQKAFDSVVLMARSALGENVFAAAWGQGAVLTPEEGFALALSGIGETPENES